MRVPRSSLLSCKPVVMAARAKVAKEQEDAHELAGERSKFVRQGGGAGAKGV